MPDYIQIGSMKQILLSGPIASSKEIEKSEFDIDYLLQ